MIIDGIFIQHMDEVLRWDIQLPQQRLKIYITVKPLLTSTSHDLVGASAFLFT